MSSISTLGTRHYQNTALAGSGSGQQTSKSNATTPTDAASKLSSNVALSSGAVDLQKRVDALGNDTVDLAQNLLGSFAQKMFGDDARGATIDFDSVSLEASSSVSAGRLRAEGSDGVTSASGFSLNESSHFLGKGTITMADGSKYDFEIEVQYEATASYAESSTAPKSERDKLIEQNPAMPLPAIEFPDVDWPGSLSDLFKLMDKGATGDVKDEATGDKLGTLSLRLLNLVSNTQSLDTFGTGKTGAQAYAAELAAGGVRHGKDVKDVTDVKDTPASESQAAADNAPIKVNEPLTNPDPAADPATVKSAGDIPLTISTTPAADPAA
ncbi:hypothetical protein IP91_03994 [Pseudoduganella lurida]|uniref:Uncharacterized protein n=1 Tax=Pseudoduganella lurida TaxID=1036180 RepID=A0A562R0A9_9BURK|nr:hypothetical protein [Pseudoduganella lurida]TWI62477.1 hypothetical protein IP91_03994 [Pseudoduganella lurida]